MIIKLKDLLRSIGASQDLHDAVVVKEIKLQDRIIKFPYFPKIEATATNTQDEIIVTGFIEGAALLPCSRCLEEFRWNFKIDFFDCFNKKGSAAINLNQDLDLSKDLIQHIVLNIPIKVLCADNCRGICSGCGADLNHQNCSCQEQILDPRWEKLRHLLDKER